MWLLDSIISNTFVALWYWLGLAPLYKRLKSYIYASLKRITYKFGKLY